MTRQIAGREYDARIECPGCGFYLGYIQRTPDGLVNVDPHPQPKAGPRLAHDTQRGRWEARCKCGVHQVLRDDSLTNAVAAVTAAGLWRMPFKNMRGDR